GPSQRTKPLMTPGFVVALTAGLAGAGLSGAFSGPRSGGRPAAFSGALPGTFAGPATFDSAGGGAGTSTARGGGLVADPEQPTPTARTRGASAQPCRSTMGRTSQALGTVTGRPAGAHAPRRPRRRR